MSTEANVKKSEILFLYETSYNIPNGDPFTGEQRYDEETKKILVSDVRIKRFVRDYLGSKENIDIYIQSKSNGEPELNEESNMETESKEEKSGSGSARRIDELAKKYKDEINQLLDSKKQKDKKSVFSQALFVMQKCIDVRLFGGISTKKKDSVNLTGPVQFALLNPSLNPVDLRMHQNTSVFESKQGNSQGAIGTTTLVPYSVMQIHGWVNPEVAEATELNVDDLKLMFEGLWYGTSGEGSSFSRSKVGQNSVLLLEIVYKEAKKKIYGVDRLISIKPVEGKKGESIRSMDDYEFDLEKLLALQENNCIERINYYTEIPEIESQFKGKDIFVKMGI
ncbi:MAG: CRISPR-associated protein [Paludibacteraceae bacterium]|nr:CRISPR-associated protein [Paludibacteraceae bacterium]